MRESPHQLAALRRRVARLAGNGGQRGGRADGRLASGDADFDRALGGGLAAGCIHEFFAADALDAPSAAAFAALLALRVPGNAPLLWLRTAEAARPHSSGGHLYAPGVAELGGDPGRLLLIETADTRALLAAANDAARCPGSAAVVVESWGAWPALDLTAGRRLTLGARDAGTLLLLLRLNAAPVPSVAETRWAVAAAPSQALEADAPGAPAFTLDLLRRRGGPAGGRWRLDWNRDEKCFAGAALSGAVLPLPAHRASQPRGAAAA
jgi:protein ImuA